MSYFKVDKYSRLRTLLERFSNNPKSKLKTPNIGQRSLYESISSSSRIHKDVIKTLDKIKRYDFIKKSVLIGGIALDHWVRGSRDTEDVDLFFLTDQKLPNKDYWLDKGVNIISKGKNRPTCIEDKETGVIIDLVTPSLIGGLPRKYAAYVKLTAITSDGINVASPEALILLKLAGGREKDYGDIRFLLELPTLELSKIGNIIDPSHRRKLKELIPDDAIQFEGIDQINKHVKSRAVRISEALKRLHYGK